MNETLEQLISDEDFFRLRELQANFRPFSALSVEEKETCHTSVLAWLLDQEGSHGLGATFLRRFLSLQGGRPVMAFEADRIANVFSERSFIEKRFGEEMVKTESARNSSAGPGEEENKDNNRIDIIIEGTDWLIAIEGKIRSKEGINQLPRYYRALKRYSGTTSKTFNLVYLTLGDGMDRVSAAIDYLKSEYTSGANISSSTWKESVADLLSSLLAGTAQNSFVTAFLQSYVDLLEALTDVESTEEEQILLRLREKYLLLLIDLKRKVAKNDLSGGELTFYLRNAKLLNILTKKLPAQTYVFFENLVKSLGDLLNMHCGNDAPQRRMFKINDEFELVVELRFKAKRPDVEFRIATRPKGNRFRQVEAIGKLQREITKVKRGEPWYCLHGRNCTKFSSTTSVPSWVKVWSYSIKIKGNAVTDGADNLALVDKHALNKVTKVLEDALAKVAAVASAMGATLENSTCSSLSTCLPLGSAHE